MLEEHRNGFSCEDAEDRIDDLEAELGAAYRSLVRIHTWLGKVLEAPLDVEWSPWALIEDAYNEAREKVEL